MAIELITGLPGNAKTLHALGLAIERSAREQRPVYYAGLKGFKADDPRLKGITWTEFDPLNWHETVPSGSIILIDEAQKIFRSRTLGTVPGKHVTELEEHRHKGLDFYMITQHPSLIDPAIRKLTQTHRHMMRIWGMEASTVHVWNGVRDACDKAGTRTDSEKTKWKFNKALYGLYQSADQHTMKRSIPARVKMLVGLGVVFTALLIYIGGFLAKKFQGETPQGVEQSATQQTTADRQQQVPASQVASAPPVDPVEEMREYVRQETPRVTGLAHTAPKYDEITKPVRAPVPAACIQIGSLSAGKTPGCKCYSQQGTPMAVEYNMCISIAQNGYFLDFDPEQGRAQEQRAAKGQEVLSNRPDSPPPPRSTGSQIVAFADIPDGPRVSGAAPK